MILEKTILEMGGELPSEMSNVVLGPDADPEENRVDEEVKQELEEEKENVAQEQQHTIELEQKLAGKIESNTKLVAENEKLITKLAGISLRV